MSANRPTGGLGLLRQRVSGIAFLLVLAGLIGLSIAFYNKAFTDVVLVTLETDKAGNQLTPPSDVKINGVIVGEARTLETGSDGARITLALQPEAAARIPSNVSARLVPKTLFGEKFVELVMPARPAGTTLAAGDVVIPQDRTQSARETEDALNNLLPLLQTLQPDVVSTTLNAVSTALRGRGDRIGSNLVLARDYFAQFNPELPTLQENFRGTADFADTVTAATPDIVSLLDDLSAINRNLVDSERELDTFLRATAGVSGTIEDFVRENEQRFIRLAAEGRPPLELFATYAPEFPCMAQSLVESDKFIGDTFGRLQPGLHITLEFTQDQGPYVPGDEPRYRDDRGPDCFGLPRPEVPAEDFNFYDGFRDDLPRETTARPEGGSSAAFAPASYSQASADRRAVNAVVAPVLGTSPDRVPDVAHLLFAPVARGTVVGLSGGSPSRSAT